MTASIVEAATGAAVAMAEHLATQAAQQSSEGAAIVAKAVQLLEQGSHAELTFAISPDVILATLGVRTQTGDLHRIGSVRFARQQKGHC